jgi:hypothetical protein
MNAVTARSREAEAFLDARQHVGPEIVSACEGWTAHEVTAHLAGTAAEITRHLEPYLAGQPVPATRTFEAREPYYRAMDDATLGRRLETEEATARSVIDQVLVQEPEAIIPWTGRQMVVAKFLPHLRAHPQPAAGTAVGLLTQCLPRHLPASGPGEWCQAATS